MSICAYVFSLFFPRKCIFCGQLVHDNEECCVRCTERLGRCTRTEMARSENIAYLRACAAPFDYAGFAREKIVQMKWASNRHYAPCFAAAMEGAVRTSFQEVSFDVVTCVPNWEPKGKRVYNHARVLARCLAARLCVSLDAQVLMQTRDKCPQHTLHADQRRTNVHGVYAVREEKTGKIQNATVLLVDNVVTTGSTLSVCAKVLTEAGAKNVYGVCALSSGK